MVGPTKLQPRFLRSFDIATDSGLVDGIGADDVRSGTPAYMSPEQLAGREVTVRSDVYALGLVLYELFTGKRAFDGRTVQELSRQREDLPEDPSSVVGDLIGSWFGGNAALAVDLTVPSGIVLR